MFKRSKEPDTDFEPRYDGVFGFERKDDEEETCQEEDNEN